MGVRRSGVLSRIAMKVLSAALLACPNVLVAKAAVAPEDRQGSLVLATDAVGVRGAAVPQTTRLAAPLAAGPAGLPSGQALVNSTVFKIRTHSSNRYLETHSCFDGQIVAVLEDGEGSGDWRIGLDGTIRSVGCSDRYLTASSCTWDNPNIVITSDPSYGHNKWQFETIPQGLGFYFIKNLDCGSYLRKGGDIYVTIIEQTGEPDGLKWALEISPIDAASDAPADVPADAPTKSPSDKPVNAPREIALPLKVMDGVKNKYTGKTIGQDSEGNFVINDEGAALELVKIDHNLDEYFQLEEAGTHNCLSKEKNSDDIDSYPLIMKRCNAGKKARAFKLDEGSKGDAFERLVNFNTNDDGDNFCLDAWANGTMALRRQSSTKCARYATVEAI